jgi:hypothetical protein
LLTLRFAAHRPIDVFIHFDGKRASDMAPSRYAVRHLITREVSLFDSSVCLATVADCSRLQMEAEEIRRSQGEGVTHNASDIIAAYTMCVLASTLSPSRR